MWRGVAGQALGFWENLEEEGRRRYILGQANGWTLSQAALGSAGRKSEEVEDVAPGPER